MNNAHAIAETILAGFDKHYRLFRETSCQAKQRFQLQAWQQAQAANKARIQMYDQRVQECVDAVNDHFATLVTNEKLWPQIKLAYINLLHNHRQPELAETFYNSVACRILHRRYYNNDFLFWRPAVATDHIDSEQPSYHCYYPSMGGPRRILLTMLTRFKLANPFANLRRDVRYLLRALEERFPPPWDLQPNFQLQILTTLFYRNKAAYIIGRAINGNYEQGFAIPLLLNEESKLYVDTLLLDALDISRLFSFSRAYFMVDMEVPSNLYLFFAHYTT